MLTHVGMLPFHTTYAAPVSAQWFNQFAEVGVERRRCVRESGSGGVAYRHVAGLGDLPELDQHSDSDADQHHERGLVVEEIQEDDQLADGVEEDGAHGQALNVLAVLPERNVYHHWLGQSTRTTTNEAHTRTHALTRVRTILEGQEVKDRVQERDGDRETKDPRVGVEQHALELVGLAFGDAHGILLHGERLFHLRVDLMAEWEEQRVRHE